MSPRVSCPIARQYHFHRNDEFGFGPAYESGSYASDGFLKPVSLVFDGRDKLKASVFLCFRFSMISMSPSILLPPREVMHLVRLIPADDCQEVLEPSESKTR